jgi:hypothetical protein
MPVFEVNLSEACLPDETEDFIEDWSDEDDDEYGYWDLIFSLLASMETANPADRAEALELVRVTLYEWIDALYEEADANAFEEYLDFEREGIALRDSEIQATVPLAGDDGGGQKRDTETSEDEIGDLSL